MQYILEEATPGTLLILQEDKRAVEAEWIIFKSMNASTMHCY